MKRLILSMFAALMLAISVNAQSFGQTLDLDQINSDQSSEQSISEGAFTNALEYSDHSESSGLNSSIVCDSIFLGTVILPADTICFLDTLAISIDSVFVPTEPVGINGFVWAVSTADLANSTDPFNDPSFLGAFGGLLAGPIDLENVYDLNLGIADGTFFVTPIAMGGAIDTDGSFGGLDFTDGCLLTGNSVPFTLLPTFDPLTVTADVVPASSGNNGEATANATGGSGDYSYLWSTAETTQSIMNLAVGTYTVTVSDNVNECVDDFVLEVMVAAEEIPESCDSIMVGILEFVDPTVCFLDSLQFNMTGETFVPQQATGINGFSYAVHSADVSGSASPFTEASFLGAFGGILAAPIEISALYDGMLGLPAGTYFITPIVMGGAIDTDGNFSGLDFSEGCVLTGNSVEFTLIEEYQPLTVTASGVDEITPPGNNGEASVMVTAGSGSYSYLWSNGETTSSISGLAGGTYMVTITDDSGCLDDVVEEIVLDVILDVNDIEGTKYLEVFPNPADKNATISYAFDQTLDLQVTVMNKLGQLVYSNQVNQTLEGNIELNLSSFTNGLYFVKISDGTNQNVRKLIVNK